MTSKIIRIIVLLALISTSALMTGCKTVMPWEKAVYAEYHMHPERDPLARAMNEHTFFTREASSGGAGIGGGGCGCN